MKQHASLLTPLLSSLAGQGYVFVHADIMRQQLAASGLLNDWNTFAASWNDLKLDTHMADHGRYRLRRYGVYAASLERGIERQPDEPHYQHIDYNPLNGNVARWFEPISAEISATQSMQTTLRFCHTLFGALAPATRKWHIEVHQFRIEARAGERGLPTPEGMHRDGVDYVLVLLIKRQNIASGTTMIRTADGQHTDSFTLTEPFDAALVDDARVYHGVTPVEPLDENKPAWRDVLVVTFRGS